MASNNQFVTFNNGETYPILGFGTWKVIILNYIYNFSLKTYITNSLNLYCWLSVNCLIVNNQTFVLSKYKNIKNRENINFIKISNVNYSVNIDYNRNNII